jgi:Na+-translocating ferredoxin:NAD+ oxidoreductase RnfA subunit
MILQRLILSTFKIDTSEFSLTFLTAFVSLSEGSSIVSSLIIGIVIILSFYFLVPLISAIRHRIDKVTIHTDMKSGGYLLLILAILIFALYFWNISWLNKGVYL